MNWRVIYSQKRIRRRSQVPGLRIGLYRCLGGWWVAVITCIESCAYKSKSYRFKQDAMKDAMKKKRELEKDIDESIAADSDLLHGGTSKSKH